MNKKYFLSIPVMIAIFIIVGISQYFNYFGLFGKSTPAVVSKNGIYENEFMKVTIPSGWIVKEATKNVYKNGDSVNNPIPTIEPNPATVNITKENYILSINARASQASGVQGGRFGEISGRAPSVQATMSDPSVGGYCGTAETESAMINNLRNDLFVGPKDNKNYLGCIAPANGETVWYFSYITGKDGGYFNYFNIIPNYNQAAGWVATMSYNSKNVNLLPVKGSAELGQNLIAMSDIIKTLTIKLPVPYAPEVSKAIQNMSNTKWSSSFYEGANSPVVSCTDTVNTSNISQDSVQMSLNMESDGLPDGKTDYTSADIQTRVAIIAGLLTNDGWSKCNSITKTTPASTKYYNGILVNSTLGSTNIVDVYKKGKEIVNIDQSSYKNVNGLMSNYIVVTFDQLK